MLLPLLLALVARLAAAATGGSYALVADAGSTGTRMYLFYVNMSGDGKVQITDLGKGPALSSFKETPEKAADAVRPQLVKAKDHIPEAMHGSVPVSVFATAGMRLVSQEAQDAIYGGLKTSLLQGDFPFNRDRLHARTISGREEGIFALIAANYLAKNLHASLEVAGKSLMGVLDLGGSSTQVATPPSLDMGEHLAPKLGSGHTFVRSFLKLGMERMRQRTFQSFVDAAPAALRERRAVSNPCSFYGYTEKEEAWRGTGHAAACEEAVAAVLAAEKESCAAATAAAAAENATPECLGASPVPTPHGPTSTVRFFLISGYMYVTDFARWWLDQPGVRSSSLQVLQEPGAFSTPSIAELREAAAVLCAEPWEGISAAALDPARKHHFTGAHKVPHRCFEINYIAALLSVGYGFGPDEKIFRIVEDIDGREIEWTLGAFLHSLTSEGSDSAAQEL
mmetsp:Transcript_68544/g.216728  ORF Transcript_68544/g.216728 Transcript_68544/m.216728 type:complete len:452 (-) Transcript_68544:21-1376(-)